jgi:hypothetical protein
MADKVRCQSCGMPLDAVEDVQYYGTNRDGKPNGAYCKFCFQDGAFVQPDLTVEGMIAASVGYMTQKMGVPREKAEEMSRGVIPGLARWQPRA